MLLPILHFFISGRAQCSAQVCAEASEIDIKRRAVEQHAETRVFTGLSSRVRQARQHSDPRWRSPFSCDYFYVRMVGKGGHGPNHR